MRARKRLEVKRFNERQVGGGWCAGGFIRPKHSIYRVPLNSLRKWHHKMNYLKNGGFGGFFLIFGGSQER